MHICALILSTHMYTHVRHTQHAQYSLVLCYIYALWLHNISAHVSICHACMTHVIEITVTNCNINCK